MSVLLSFVIGCVLTIAGLLVVLVIIVQEISELFELIRSLFGF